MKKILIIGLCLLAVSGMAQKKQSGMFNYLFFDRMLGSGSDSLISPADTSGHFWFSNMENPVSELDGVNKRTLDTLAGTKADTSTVLPTIRTAVTQATATSVDNSLLKTVGTLGRAVEQTGVTVSDGNIVSAPTFSATNLTDGYVPYHINDALGQGNSVIYNDAVNGRVGINYPSGGSALHIAAKGSGDEKIIMTLSNRNDIYGRRWDFTIGKGVSPNYYELRIKQEAAPLAGDLVLQPGRNTRIESNVGIDCVLPTSKLSVLGQSSTNLNLFNFVNGDTNKLRTTFTNATDTSSTHLSYTSTGSPEFHIVGKAGNQLFLQDSVKTVMGSTTNNTTFESDGSMLMSGTATVFDDLFFPFESGESGVTNIPVFVADSSYYTFTVDTTGVSKCIKYFTIQLPHSWKEGSDIFPHVHYKHETAVGTPKFIMKYKWYNTGESTAFGWNWYKMEATTGTDNNTVQMSYNSSGGISGSGKTISSILICQVYLSATPTNVNAYQFDIHIEKDRLGSRTETTK